MFEPSPENRIRDREHVGGSSRGPLQRPGVSHERLPSSQLHLSDYLAILKKRRIAVILPSLILIGLVAALSLLSTPLYQGSAQIVIERQKYPMTRVEEMMNTELRETEFYQTQYNLLRSRNLALSVIKDLELGKDFAPVQSMQDTPPEKIPEQPSDRNPSANPDQEQAAGRLRPGDGSSQHDYRQIIDWYLAHLKIDPVRGSRLINISFLSPSPDTAAKVASTHAHAFIRRDAETKLTTSQQSLAWIRTQLQEQRKNLEASRKALYEYKEESGVVSFEERQNIVTQKLMDLNANLTKVKSERMAKQAVYEQLTSFSMENENIFSLPEVARDEVILSLRTQLIQLKAKKSELATTFGPRHPKMIDLHSQIRQAEEELTAEIQRQRKSIRAELDRAVDYENSLQRSLNTQKIAALSMNKKAITHEVLLQEAQSHQQIYDNLLKQGKELGLAGAIENSNVRIVDEAEVPASPVSPRTLLNMLLAVAISMVMGPTIAFFMEYMDTTLKTPEDIQRRTGLGVLGTVPFDASLTRNGSVPLPCEGALPKEERGQYAFDAVQNHLVTHLRRSQTDLPAQVLMVASAAAGEGRTAILAKSALSLARGGMRVLMVDADLSRPTLHRMFCTRGDNGTGLSHALSAVLSQDVLRGTLNDYSVDDLFFISSLKRLSGRLLIESDTQEMSVHFQNGQLRRIQSRQNPEANRLGNMLLRSGHITEGQLQESLERNERAGLPLGYILVNAGCITREKLRGPLKLQMEEYLQKIFSWRQGSFFFAPGDAEPYDDARISFEEDYRPMIRRLGSLSGNRFMEHTVLPHISPVDEPNLYLLPAGSAFGQPLGPAHFSVIEKILDMLKKRFDVVLVDGPPVLDAAGSIPLALAADKVIFVVKAGHLSAKAVNEAITALQEADVDLLGAVLNQAKSERHS